VNQEIGSKFFNSMTRKGFFFGWRRIPLSFSDYKSAPAPAPARPDRLTVRMRIADKKKKSFALQDNFFFQAPMLKARRRRHRLTCLVFFTRTSDIAIKDPTEKSKNSSKLFGKQRF
jgi:hypothetical protein